MVQTSGGGVFGHLDGPAAGARSLRQAYEAWKAGSNLLDCALEHPELAGVFYSFPGDADQLDYVYHIMPQFSRTHVNFQRVPVVDTSNPFIARDIPTLDESLVVVRFRDPKNADFPYLLKMIHDSFMSRPNCLVVPGGKMEMAIQLVATPLVLQMMERSKRAIRADVSE